MAMARHSTSGKKKSPAGALFFVRHILFEQELCKLVETATPGVPFVGGTFRDVAYGVDADAPEALGSLHHSRILLAAVAHEHDLVGLFESGCAIDVIDAHHSAPPTVIR